MQATMMSKVHQHIWTAFRDAPAWRCASDAALARLISTSRVRCIGKGECVLLEGDAPDHMIFVVDGHVRAVVRTPSGRRLTIATAWGGDTIGVAHVIADTVYPFDVEAGERSVVAVVPAAALLGLMHAEPGVQMSVLQIAAKQSIDLTNKLSSMNLDIAARVATFLLEHVAPDQQAARTDLRMSRVELADLLGTVPETLSRTFTNLRERGLIASDGGRQVTVLDRNGLAAIAAG